LNNVGSGFLTGGDGENLTISGGNTFDASTAGDLILRGGISSLGSDGSVIIDSDLTVTGNVTFTGSSTTPNPIEFFIPGVIMSGLNPNLTMDSKGIVKNVSIELSGHVGYAEIAPTDGPTTYRIQRIRGGTITQIGSVIFNTGVNLASNITITSPSLQPNDIVRIVNPATPDSGINNVTITLRANIV
jgi:hypothetical protein